ncbi:zinc finger domain-containing protein [Streptomyces sp. NPDC003032]
MTAAADAVERNDCPKCEVPVGSACRTRGGKTATKYHTPRFVLIAALREHLDVLVPADRGPGRPWKQGPAPAAVPAQRDSKLIRIGYARTSTARQELASQLEALHAADCHKVFSELISTRIKVRPELEAALKLAHQFKEAAPEATVIFTVHELKRLARFSERSADRIGCELA